MIITSEFTMPLDRIGVSPVVDVVRGDANTRAVKISLTSGGAKWDIPIGASVSIAFQKADGKKGLYNKLPNGKDAATFSSNTIVFVLAPEVLTFPGKVNVSVILNDENLNQLSTFPIIVNVEDNPAAGTVLSNDYYNYSTLEEINDAIDELYKYLSSASTSIVNESNGTVIKLNDSSNSKLQGLKIFGQGGDEDALGNNGSITVKVMGKNIITLDAQWLDDNGTPVECFTKQEDGSYKSKVILRYNYLLPCSFPSGTYSVSCYIKCPVSTNYRFCVYYTDGTRQDGKNIDGTNVSTGDWLRCEMVTNGKAITNFGFFYGNQSDQVYVKDLQFEVGSGATVYEPYKEPQTITVPTTDSETGLIGLRDSDGIDFEKGVLWRDDGGLEYPLPADVMEAYAKLHTHKPDTTIINDVGADMEVIYLADTKAYIDNKFNELAETLTALTGV